MVPLALKSFALCILHMVAVCVFLKGFLLTRIELPDVTAPDNHFMGSTPPYSKAVIVIVDAVRYDFVCHSSTELDLISNSMPRTMRLVEAMGEAAAVSKFVADTPTITMSRLKALLTGGLPTFLDIGQSFSASRLTEDNLLHQLLKQNKKLVVLGDDTWIQLAGDAFIEAYPYPSFDVRDLDTVDNGVWQHLPPLLERPDSWDVLIAHYLGVDHAGHTYGVKSRQMAAKLAQMDDQVSCIIELLTAQAGPGGAYSDTVLLVLSDHGQTLGGDHGGGTVDETDSALVAVNLRKAHAVLQQQQQPGAHQKAVNGTNSTLPAALQQQQRTRQQQHQQTECHQEDETTQQVCDLPAAAASEDGSCLAHDSREGSKLLYHLMAAGAYIDTPVDSNRAISGASWNCASKMSQIDVTPLLAYCLGVPIPFGNLGKLPPHLFLALMANSSSAVGQGDEAWLAEYTTALHANVDQVHKYLNRYAIVGGLPADELASVNRLYAAIQQSRMDDWPRTRQSGSQEQQAILQLEETVVPQLQYVSAAAKVARRRFTLFQQGPIWAGCALGMAVLMLQLAVCWWALRSFIQPGLSGLNQTIVAVFLGLVASHNFGLFSVGILMGEGRVQCLLVAAVTLLLLRAALAAAVRAQEVEHSRGRQCELLSNGSAAGTVPNLQLARDDAVSAGAGVAAVHCQPLSNGRPLKQLDCFAAAAIMLVCNLSLQLLGLIDRSGKDPHDKTQPAADLLVGAGAIWQQLLYSCATVGPVLCIWWLATWTAKWLRQRQLKPADYHGVQPRAWPWYCVSVVQGLCVVQHGCIALFWIIQLFGGTEASILSSMRSILMFCQRGLHGTYINQQPLQSSVWLASVTNFSTILALLQGLLQIAPVATMLHLPMRLLLPRVVYAACIATVGATVMVAAGVALAKRMCKHTPACSHDMSPCQGQQVLGLMWYWLCASTAAVLIMVLGYKGSLTMLLAFLQAACACNLLQAASARVHYASAVLQSTAPDKLQQQIDDSAHNSHLLVVGSGLWGMMSLQLFFCSGHFCEFSGLQYASAFTGVDSMVWYISGPLLLLNTCGVLVLGCMTLPLMLVAVCPCGTQDQPGTHQFAVGNGISGQVKAAAEEKLAADHCVLPGTLQQQLWCSMLVVNSIRFAALVVCMISAAVQQQHILLWAIFAPKLVFELCFMAVVDVAQLLTALYAQSWHSSPVL